MIGVRLITANLRDHRFIYDWLISVTGRVERLTRAPRVSLQGLSTRFTTVTRALTAVICGFGDRDHILRRET